MVRKGGNMRSLRSLVIAVLVLCPGVRLGAQAPSAAPSDHVAAIKESLQKSMAELREYQWVQTTVISIKGEEKSRTQDSCYYGADGSLQKTPIPNEPESQAKEPRGIRGKIVEHKQEDISDSAKQAVALVKEYVPPDPARIQAAKEAGNLSVVPPDSQGGAKVVIRNYLKTGDSITLQHLGEPDHRTVGLDLCRSIEGHGDSHGFLRDLPGRHGLRTDDRPRCEGPGTRGPDHQFGLQEDGELTR
jgi:hypothetical protein